MKQQVTALDLKFIALLRRAYIPVARASIFVVFFWFGFIKLIGESPASPLARALTEQTIGLQYFEQLFFALALLECIIGVLFLVPKATRAVIPLLFMHMAMVCAPLVLLTDYTWQSFLVPTLEGQYIIKNIVVVAVAIGIAATTAPIASRKKI